MKMRQIIGWLGAVIITAVGVVYQQNIAAFATQHHYDVLIFRLLAAFVMFSHTQQFAFICGCLSTSVVVVIYVLAKEAASKRDLNVNPIQIEFDESNPNRHFWSDRRVSEDERDFYSSDTVTNYRVKITNRTGKTIKGVKIARLFNGGWKDQVNFPSILTPTFDLHPGASEFVPIYVFDEIHEMNSENDPGYLPQWSFLIQITGMDVRTCERVIHVDVTKTPVLSFVKR